MSNEKSITWTAPAGILGGGTFTGGRIVQQDGETMVDFGTQTVGGAKRTLKVRIADKPELAAKVREIVAEQKKAADAKAAEEKASHERIENGTDPIKVTYHYHDGEYLTGYAVSGYAAELLEKLGLAKDVRGWGTHVKNEVIDALGESFTYPAAVAFAKPGLDEEKAKLDAKNAERQAKRRAAFEQAKLTGRPVEIRRWSATCDGSVEECDIDILSETAQPDGTTKISRSHTH
jgi:hypothetical protein